MVSKKPKNNILIYSGIAIICAFIIGGAFYISGERQTAVVTGGSFHTISRGDIELEFDSADSAEQDDPDDVEWHIMEITEDDLATLKSEGYADCDTAYNNPIIIDFSSSSIEIAEEGMQWISDSIDYNPAFCKINWYKAWNTGNLEDEMEADNIEIVAKDLDDVDSDAGGTEEATMSTSGKYLIFVREITTGDREDIVPMMFIIELADKVEKSLIGQDSFDDFNVGTTNVRLIYNYLSDALEAGEYKISGTATDDEQNSNDLTSALNGFCDSSLTTSTSIDLEVEIELEITESGYAIILDNPLATGSSEKAYLTLTPYGENTTDGNWQEYETLSGLDGDVAYSTSEVSTKQFIFTAEMQDECDYTLVGDSGTDAVIGGNEKLYDCVEGQVAKGRNSAVTWHIFIDELLVDYDDSATDDDEEVNCNSGSSGEDLFDIDLIGLANTTADKMAQTLSP